MTSTLTMRRPRTLSATKRKPSSSATAPSSGILPSRPNIRPPTVFQFSRGRSAPSSGAAEYVVPPDRLRGTLHSGDASDPDHLGVPGEVTTYPQGWSRQLIHPLRVIRRGLLSPATLSMIVLPVPNSWLGARSKVRTD